MISYALPSRTGELRERRIRAIRRVLTAHAPVSARDAANTVVVTECACGWRAREFVTSSAAYLTHLADSAEVAL